MPFDSATVQQALAPHLRNAVCPMCSGREFLIPDGVVEFISRDALANDPTAPGYVNAAVMSACKKCGSITFHAASVIGLAETT